MNTEETIKDMRRRCRLAMNGIVSSNMRSYGLDYKLNFGVSLQKIREIAGHYMPDKDLAEILWQEDVRELKILATLLFPVADFEQNRAEAWLRGIRNQEIREQICANLFQKLPYAEVLANGWSNNMDEIVRTTGYWLLAGLLLAKRVSNGVSAKSFRFLLDDTGTASVSLRNAAILALKQFVKMSEAEAEWILLSTRAQNELYGMLNFEFEYYYANK